MQARLVDTAPEKAEADALILPVFEGEKAVPAEAAALDKKLRGTIADLLKGDGFKGKFMELVPVHNLSSVPSRWTVLAGVGKREHLDMVRLRNVLQAASRSLRKRGTRSIAVIVPTGVARQGSGADVARAVTEGIGLGNFEAASLKTRPDRTVGRIGSLEIPKAVRSYMGGREKIAPGEFTL